MRFIAFSVDGQRHLGVRSGDNEVVDLHGSGLPDNLEELLAAGPAAMEAARKVVQGRAPRHGLDTLHYLPPLSHPAHSMAAGLNYMDHANETKLKAPEFPILFNRFPSSWVGHRQGIVRPSISDSFDFESEFVVVIGQGGRYIDRARALEHVAGYALFNEGTVREFQFKSPQWMLGKNFHRSGGFGPEFITADELPPGAAGLQLRGFLNGQEVQSGNTRDLIFDVATLIHAASQALLLQPGDMIITGTPAGVGWARSPRLLMQPGDEFRVTLEGFLPLVNPVVAE